jgi:hypothetical protein
MRVPAARINNLDMLVGTRSSFAHAALCISVDVSQAVPQYFCCNPERTTISLMSKLHRSVALMRDAGRAPSMSAADNVLGERTACCH